MPDRSPRGGLRNLARLGALGVLAALAGGCTCMAMGAPSSARTMPLPSAGHAVHGLPGTIHECETNTATLCATWERVDPTHYRSAWPDGSEATITVVRFDRGYVDFRRADSSGKTAGMYAAYTAEVVEGRLEHPAVVWFYEGQQFTGRWSATW